MTILKEVSDGVARLTLNRPDRLNALTTPMIEDMLETLRSLATDGKVRAVVLAGAGRAFCAGYDLAGTGETPREWTPDEAAAQLLLHAQIPVLLRRMAKPVIAAIQGAAAGSGVVLAAACDLRIASTTAKFKLAFASAGRCGDPGGSYLLTKLIGSARSRELFLLDEAISAERAYQYGLVNQLVEPAELEETVQALALRLAKGPTSAFAAMKRHLNAAEAGVMEETMAAEAVANAQASLSHDGKEAARAFLEKRPPAFRGY